MTDVYAPISVGRFVADRVKGDNGRGYTLVKSAAGETLGSIIGRPRPGESGRKARLYGVDFAARGGTWFLPANAVTAQPGDPTGPGRPILDASGQIVARFERPASAIRLIHLSGSTLTWQHYALRPTYRIEEGYSASRTMLHQWFSGVTNRPFTGEIGNRLASVPDGILALLLAAFFTNNAINEQNRRQQTAWAVRDLP